MNNLTNWIYYGINGQGVKVVFAMKYCKNPERTKEYKQLMELLEYDTYERVGVETAKHWNKSSQFIKFNEYGV